MFNSTIFAEVIRTASTITVTLHAGKQQGPITWGFTTADEDWHGIELDGQQYDVNVIVHANSVSITIYPVSEDGKTLTQSNDTLYPIISNYQDERTQVTSSKILDMLAQAASNDVSLDDSEISFDYENGIATFGSTVVRIEISQAE